MDRELSFNDACRLYVGRVFLCMLCCFASVAQADTYDDFIFAVKFNDVQTVQALLGKGMDANATEQVRGETVMMIALREKSGKVFAALLKHPDIKLEARASNGDTALMLASYLQNLPAVSQLIAAGASINQAGWTALHYAAAVGDTPIMLALFDKTADINAESPNKTTPLMMAVRSGNTAVVQLLLDKGADIHRINDLGLSALDFAVQLEKREITAVLSARLKQNGKSH
ncbi:MAG: ankyrin repeat domain-containing protein [Undibacterium sp.]|nr:ankyrin repeat domain-containing protein [Undibacterium sp.]